MKNIFVTGTDTGVGKTIISYVLMHYFMKKHKNPLYLKIFQTGCVDVFDKDCDARFVYANLLRSIDRNFLMDKICYLFKNPKAPYFAALDENKEIDISFVKSWVKEKIKDHFPVIFEGAGGLMVPINEKTLIIDLIKDMDVDVILIARPGLGTINHTLLSIEALRKRGIPIKGIIFSMKEQNEAPKDLIYENIKAISNFSGIDVFLIGPILDFSKDMFKYYNVFEEMFK